MIMIIGLSTCPPYVWRPGQGCQGLLKTTDESTTDCAVRDTETIAAVRAAHVSCHVCRNCPREIILEFSSTNSALGQLKSNPQGL